MPFREHDTLEATCAALEELRLADAILSALLRPGAARMTWGWFWAVWPDLTHARAEVARADVHLRCAIRLTDGRGWTDGIDDDGSPLPLDTTLGLRRAVRQYFDRLRDGDPRIGPRVPPLDPERR